MIGIGGIAGHMFVNMPANRTGYLHKASILQDMSAVKDVDALVIAVCHKEFEGLDQAAIESFFNPTNGKKVLVDVKGILNRKEWTRDDCLYWRL